MLHIKPWLQTDNKYILQVVICLGYGSNRNKQICFYFEALNHIWMLAFVANVLNGAYPMLLSCTIDIATKYYAMPYNSILCFVNICPSVSF